MRVYYAFHKPVGVISTLADPHGRRTLAGFLPPGARLFPVGRHDADSSGLLLLTNDGDLAHRLSHRSFRIPRTYWVKVKGKPSAEEMRKLSRGISLEDVPTAPCRIAALRETRENAWMEMTLHEGRKRQVKGCGEWDIRS